MVVLAAGLLMAASLFASGAPSRSTQMIVVTTADWDTLHGSLQRFEREKGSWRAVGEPIEVVVGRNGLAWGVNSDKSAGGPVKREGDGRSPAGRFRITELFGYAPKSEAAGFKLPYVQATPTLECVDDAGSSHYNQVIDRTKVAHPDWNSSEKMRRDDELYRWGAIVDYNMHPAKAAAGSCIFLHIASTPLGNSKGTAGCTAMPEPQLLEVLRWLDARRNPVLVQLPRDEYQRLKSKWGLPALR